MSGQSVTTSRREKSRKFGDQKLMFSWIFRVVPIRANRMTYERKSRFRVSWWHILVRNLVFSLRCAHCRDYVSLGSPHAELNARQCITAHCKHTLFVKCVFCVFQCFFFARVSGSLFRSSWFRWLLFLLLPFLVFFFVLFLLLLVVKVVLVGLFACMVGLVV